MYERIIIVPDVDNDGVSLESVRERIENELLAIAGGFTSDRVSGAWRAEDGKVYRDTSTRYTLAVDEAQDTLIQHAMPAWCEALRQECLFTSVRPVTVEFVTAIPATQAA